MSNKLQDTSRAILESLTESAQSSTDLSARLGVAALRVRQTIKNLLTAGLVVGRGPSRGRRVYAITAQGIEALAAATRSDAARQEAYADILDSMVYNSCRRYVQIVNDTGRERAHVYNDLLVMREAGWVTKRDRKWYPTLRGRLLLAEAGRGIMPSSKPKKQDDSNPGQEELTETQHDADNNRQLQHG